MIPGLGSARYRYNHTYNSRLQTVTHGWWEIDYADVAGDAFTAPGLSALSSAGVGFTLFAAWEPLKAEPLLLRSPAESSIMYISTQLGISVGQQGAGRISTQQQ